MSSWTKIKDMGFSDIDRDDCCDHVMMNDSNQFYCKKYDIPIEMGGNKDAETTAVSCFCGQYNMNKNLCWARFRCVAVISEEKNKMKETKELYDKEVEQNPKDPIGYIHRGSLNVVLFVTFSRFKLSFAPNWVKVLEDYFDKEIVEYAELAIKDFSVAIELNPEDAVVFAQRGGMYSLIGKNENALDDFNKAIALDNKCKHAYLSRGDMYSGAKEYKKALADLEYAAELDPSDENVLVSLENVKKLKAAEDAKNQGIYDDAVTNIKTLDNQTVSDENGYKNKMDEYRSFSVTFQTLKDYKDADEYFKQCIIKSDEFKELYQNAKKERERREAYDNAVTAIKELDNQTVSYEDGYKNKMDEYRSLSVAFQTLKDYKDADEYFKQCIIKSDEFNQLYQNAKKERERHEEEERERERIEAIARKKTATIGLLLQLGIIAGYFYILWGTPILYSLNAAKENIGTSRFILIYCAIALTIPLILGIISIIFRKKAGSFWAIFLILPMIISTPITGCVWDKGGFFSSLVTIVLGIILYFLSAIPGIFMIAFAETDGKREKKAETRN